MNKIYTRKEYINSLLEEDTPTYNLQKSHQKIMENYHKQQEQKKHDKEEQAAIEKAISEQLDKTVEKALNDIFKDFMK